MGMSEKIKTLLIKKNMSEVQLSVLLGTSPQNVYNKLKRDNFSEKELKEIANKLNVEYEGFFIFDDGTKI